VYDRAVPTPGPRAREDREGRLRVSDFRILYEVHDAVLVVLVVRVGYRREVYR
jgi:mRNA interferase RelE/StbE